MDESTEFLLAKQKRIWSESRYRMKLIINQKSASEYELQTLEVEICTGLVASTAKKTNKKDISLNATHICNFCPQTIKSQILFSLIIYFWSLKLFLSFTLV